MLDDNYWENRYVDDQTGWDIGYPSPAIVSFLDSLVDKDVKILIPGAGRSYEAEYAHNAGFKNVYVLDFAPSAIEDFKNRVPSFPHEHVLCEDFFQLNEKFDLVIEQTFFCALQPEMRSDYAKKMKELLNPGGELVGLFFNTKFEHEGPPFGGDKEEYLRLFTQYFENVEFSTAIESIAPRKGHEIWLKLSQFKWFFNNSI